VASLVEDTIKSVSDKEVEMETYYLSAIIAVLAAFVFAGIITFVIFRGKQESEDKTLTQEGRPTLGSAIRAFGHAQPGMEPPMPLG
jgi:hypothetical protein